MVFNRHLLNHCREMFGCELPPVAAPGIGSQIIELVRMLEQQNRFTDYSVLLGICEDAKHLQSILDHLQTVPHLWNVQRIDGQYVVASGKSFYLIHKHASVRDLKHLTNWDVCFFQILRE